MSEPFRQMKGSPEFYSLLIEMANTHDAKSHDYASNDDPFGNYHFSGLLAQLFSHSTEDMGFVTRIGEKLFRLANLEKSGKTPKNESIMDTERDICVITALWMASRRTRRQNSLTSIYEYLSGKEDRPYDKDRDNPIDRKSEHPRQS